jgi:hypothetical protein
MADDTLESSIEQNAKDGIKRASGDQGSMEQHPLTEQIEADRYLSSKKAARVGFGGLRLVKLIPPGAD